MPESATRTSFVDTLDESILEKPPLLRDGYNARWASQHEDLESAFLAATSRDLWTEVPAHLQAASPFMIATHQRKIDKEYSEISKLKYAPKTGVLVESGFARVDLAVNTLYCGAGVEACLGAAHASMPKAFETEGGKRTKAKTSVLKKPKRGAGGDGSVEKEVEKLVEQ